MAANERQQFESFPTPRIEDILFWEEHNSLTGQSLENREYGTPHPNDTDYPDHKLVFISPTDKYGMERWYYAADRERQDDYNWEMSFPYGGNERYPRFTRTYLEPRKTYKPLPKGSLDPRGDPDREDELDERFKNAKLIQEQQAQAPEELKSLYVVVVRTYDKVPPRQAQNGWNWTREFPYHGHPDYPRYVRRYVTERSRTQPLRPWTAEEATEQGETDTLLPVRDPVHSDAILISQRFDRFNDERDNLFVQETCIYDVVPQISDSDNTVADDEAVFKEFGYGISYPYNDLDFPRITWSFPVQTDQYAKPAEYATCPVEGYTSLLLTDEEFRDQEEVQNRGVVVRVFDSLPGPSIVSVEKFHNAGIPERFIASRTTTRTNQPVKNDASITTPAGNPTIGVGAVLVTSLQPDGGRNKAILIDGTIRQEITLNTIASQEFDTLTGTMVDVTQEIVAAGTAGSNLNASGIFEEVQDINTTFAIKTTRKATALVGNTKTYETAGRILWPAVLHGINIITIDSIDPNSGIEYLSAVRYDLNRTEAYRDEVKVDVTKTWTTAAPTGLVNEKMVTEDMTWNFVLFSGSIRNTLHNTFVVSETIGTAHPRLVFSVNSRTFNATNYTDWPATITRESVDEYRGGFLKTKLVYHKPN